MDSIDLALLDAWGRVAPRVRADRLETLRRAMRRRSGTILSRPSRDWCLSIRASDSRLNHWAWVPKYLPEQHEPHQITIFSETLRELCRPVRIDWPGIALVDAARRLGRTPDAIRSWIRKKVLSVRYEPPGPHGHFGGPVPVVWSLSPLNPNMDQGSAPDAVWGTLWQWMWQRVPEGLEFHVDRVPVWRPYPGDDRPRFRGWEFVCPGLGAGGVLPGSSDEVEGGRWESQHVACGRRVDRLFLPVRRWTMADAMGVEDPLDVVVGRVGGRDAETERRRDGVGEGGEREKAQSTNGKAQMGEGGEHDHPGQSTGMNVVRHGESSTRHGESSTRVGGLACAGCHRIYRRSLAGKPGWNLFVTELSGGLLYGHEVRRPPEFVVPLKRRYVPRRRRSPRMERVLHLLAGGLDDRTIAERAGMTYHTVRQHVKRLYRRHGGRNRAELCARAGVAYARPMPRRRGQVLELLRRGLTYRAIGARLGLTFWGVATHVRIIYRKFGVHSREQLMARLRGRVLAAKVGAPRTAAGDALVARPQS